MRVLVTGGAGYIGSFTCRSLRAAGHEVLVLDNLSTGRPAAVRKAALEVVDIRDADRLDALLGSFRPDAVVHLAGVKSVAESMSQLDDYLDINVAGSRNLLRSAVRHGVQRFVFSSSCAVYGTNQVCPIDEQAPLRPQSPYGETKLLTERLLRWYAELSGMRYASLRFFNAAGAAADGSLGEHPGARSPQIFPRMIRVALGLAPALPVYGADYQTSDGTPLRDYVHVEDLALAHVTVLEGLDSTRASGPVNLGRGAPISVLDLVGLVSAVSGREVPVELRPRRAGDPSVSWADGTLARQTFKWTAERSLPEIVRTAWDWHRAYPETLT